MQDSLESLALRLGMLVVSSLLEDEVTRLCGRRYERQPHRTHTRYGHQRGTATLAGQKIAITRPRVRRTDGGGEVPLETYARGPRGLARYFAFYNRSRPHQALGYRTPAAVRAMPLPCDLRLSLRAGEG